MGFLPDKVAKAGQAMLQIAITHRLSMDEQWQALGFALGVAVCSIEDRKIREEVIKSIVGIANCATAEIERIATQDPYTAGELHKVRGHLPFQDDDP